MNEIRRIDSFSERLVAALPKLLPFAYKLAGSNTRADDLVQTTAVKALANQTQFDGSNLMAWLFTILRNTYYDEHRKGKRRPEVGSDVFEAAAEWLSTPATQNDGVEFTETAIALSKLPPAHKRAVILVALQEKSYEEAAALEGVEVGTIKSRVNRGRQKLKDILKAGGGLRSLEVNLSDHGREIPTVLQISGEDNGSSNERIGTWVSIFERTAKSSSRRPNGDAKPKMIVDESVINPPIAELRRHISQFQCAVSEMKWGLSCGPDANGISRMVVAALTFDLSVRARQWLLANIQEVDFADRVAQNPSLETVRNYVAQFRKVARNIKLRPGLLQDGNSVSSAADSNPFSSLDDEARRWLSGKIQEANKRDSQRLADPSP